MASECLFCFAGFQKWNQPPKPGFIFFAARVAGQLEVSWHAFFCQTFSSSGCDSVCSACSAFSAGLGLRSPHQVFWFLRCPHCRIIRVVHEAISVCTPSFAGPCGFQTEQTKQTMLSHCRGSWGMPSGMLSDFLLDMRNCAPYRRQAVCVCCVCVCVSTILFFVKL